MSDLGSLDDPAPHARLLSNGRYIVLLTGAGTGYSAWNGLALTAWTADRTEDADGFFLYVRDLDRGTFWSLGHQPVRRPAERYQAHHRPGVVTIARLDDEIEARLEVAVAPDADVEVRLVHLVNRSSRPRRIEVTTYAEVVLNEAAAHASHPAFSKLFVETEYADGVLLARRRPRSHGERTPWMLHALGGEGALEYETDRARFVGRGRSPAQPLGLVSRAPLSGTTGSVLDPLLCLRRTVVLAPGESTRLVVLLGAAETRDAAVALARRHAEAAEAVLAGAEARARALLDRLGLAESEAEHFHELAGAILYGCPTSRPDAETLRKAHAFWRAKGIEIDLSPVTSPPAGGSPRTTRTFRPARAEPEGERREKTPLLFDNGYGGFTPDGREYVVRVDGERPPMPWVNVVANERFGFLVSESGAGTTWSRNSQQNRLTPWYNDPIADPHGEALYVRDEDAGVFWSPLPGPVAPLAPFEVRHGFGCSLWRHSSRELEQEVCLFAPRHDPVKVVRLRLRNTGPRARRLSVFSYARLVLGVLPARSVVTEFDPDSGAVLARNPANGEFADGVVFAAAVTEGAVRVTGDRTAFIGRNGTPADPAALTDAAGLDGRTGAGLDPCAALQVTLPLAPGVTVECAFLLGETTNLGAARALIARYRGAAALDEAFDEVRAFWRETVSAVQVETPSPAIDLMVNGWLGYQTLGCRLWGRSAFYQSGGAFGFRDQLQDAAALVYVRPELTRAQILLHAAHQFVEGDVLHWWHPPSGRGTRTRFSDDLLWLPYVTAFYVRTTGDGSVLDERVGFVTARALQPGEDEAYLLPAPSEETADVYAHCCRALDRSLTRGPHGLPLMGTGDWNDGMNRVGREGRGESVWLGFFLYFVLGEFILLCERRGDQERAGRYRAYRTDVQAALEKAGWDGAWYRRAYYDDGTPLGSATNDECRIDALAQAWAVISGAAPRERAARAMDAVERELVSRDAGLIRLLTPPFDRTAHDPGYIKGYVPGIRENGGQYTHAALWVVRAMAELGRRDRAAALLEMLSPAHHARTREAVDVYRVEPYVVAADIYGVPPHVGRGGWTWYTGSAGWMFRVALESVLGVTLEGGDTLRVAPCIPDTWSGFKVKLRLPDGKTRYEVEVENPTRNAVAVTSATVDGHPASVESGAARVALAADGALHRVSVTLGAA